MLASCMYARQVPPDCVYACIYMLASTTSVGKIDESYTQRIETDKILFRQTVCATVAKLNASIDRQASGNA